MARKQKNPFITGGRVPPELHINREIEVYAVLDALAGKGRMSCAVSGERRIGKTSFLHYLTTRAPAWGLAPSSCCFIFMDAQSEQPFSEETFWYHVVRAVAKTDFVDREYATRLLGLPEVSQYGRIDLFDRIGKEGRFIVLTVDEFDLIVSHLDPESPTLLFHLRSLLNQPTRGLAVVTASRRPLEEVCQNMNFRGSSPFHNLFKGIELGRFALGDCHELMDTYLQDTGVDFTDLDRQYMIEQSGGHPYLLQAACSKLFDYYQRSNRYDEGSGQEGFRGSQQVILSAIKAGGETLTREERSGKQTKPPSTRPGREPEAPPEASALRQGRPTAGRLLALIGFFVILPLLGSLTYQLLTAGSPKLSWLPTLFFSVAGWITFWAAVAQLAGYSLRDLVAGEVEEPSRLGESVDKPEFVEEASEQSQRLPGAALASRADFEIIAEIETLVREDQLAQALVKLSDVAAYRHDAALLIRQLNRARRQERQGLITHDVANADRTRIAKAILDLISS